MFLIYFVTFHSRKILKNRKSHDVPKQNWNFYLINNETKSKQNSYISELPKIIIAIGISKMSAREQKKNIEEAGKKFIPLLKKNIMLFFDFAETVINKSNYLKHDMHVRYFICLFIIFINVSDLLNNFR